MGMNPEAVVDNLVTWLREKVHEAGAKGVVLGVSGGVDSAVAAIIAKRAFPDNCRALLLPIGNQMSDRIYSTVVVEQFDIPYTIIELDNVYKMLVTLLESYIKLEDDNERIRLKANIKPRLRMLTLYYSAAARSYLVLGTSNKSELSIGYTTKYGDNAVDLQLLGDFLKYEIYELARYLKVPRAIINKAPSGGLWPGQTDEEDMGFSYDQLDKYLDTKEAEPSIAESIERMIALGAHKRNTAPIAIVKKY